MNNLISKLISERPTDWLTHLEADLHINAVRDGDLVSLKYDQIESPMADPVVQQCRGMVVDTARGHVLAWPYNKFWNLGEHLAAPIDWATARVQEKLDGSLMILYWHRGTWCVASSGHPTAGGQFAADARTFRDAFWDLVRALDVDPWKLEPTVTYMLELCDTPNRVVVRHERPRLVMHGARDLVMGRELSRVELESFAGAANCEAVSEFPIASPADCLAAADALNPIEQEGFVVVDARFNRVKIKSPRYVTLHHLKGEATPRRAIELWQTGESGELLTHFPEFRPIIDPVHDKLDEFARRAVSEHEDAIRRTTDRKGYASIAVQRPYSAVMFRMLTDGTANVDGAKAIMRRMSTQALERMLEVGQ